MARELAEPDPFEEAFSELMRTKEGSVAVSFKYI